MEKYSVFILVLDINNDMGMFYLSQIEEILERNNIKLLADSGYSSHVLITPNEDKSKLWNYQQRFMRSKVERVIGCVKLYSIASEKCKWSPELQIIALNIAYQLTAKELIQFPL